MEEEYKDLKITIEQDELAEDSREAFDHIGTMICFHHNYNLGDDHSYTDPKDALLSILGDYTDWEEYVGYCDLPIDELFIELEKIAYVLPLYLYDHSGITMSTSPFSCPWDSDQVGFIYAMKDYADKETPDPVKYLEGEVKEYDQYLTGEIYGYIVEDPEEYVDEDSCWGFYGYDYCLEEAKSVADWMHTEKIKLKCFEMIDIGKTTA